MIKPGGWKEYAMLPEDSYTLVAQADYGEGYSVILYKTRQDQYFSMVRTAYGRTERIQVLCRNEAIETYNRLPIHLVHYDEAFPGMVVEKP